MASMADSASRWNRVLMLWNLMLQNGASKAGFRSNPGTANLSRGNATRARTVSALAGFEAALGLVDDVDPALAPNEAVVAMARPQGFQRVTNFHRMAPGPARGKFGDGRRGN